MKTLVASAALLAAAGASTVSGCSNTLVGASGEDSGSGADATTGGGAEEGGSGNADDAGVESDGGGSSTSSPLPDGGVPPNGTLLVPSPSASVSIVGVTGDDFVVYLDTSTVTPTVYAISLAAGSKPITLGLADQNDNVVVAGNVVLFIGNGNKNGVGQLSVWTSAASAATQISSASCSSTPQSGLYAVSPDSKYVLFFDDSDTGCVTGTLTVVAADGSGKTALDRLVDLGGNYCSLMLAFAGDSAVAGYCVTSADAGAVIDASLPGGATTINVATVSSFSPPTWTPTPLIVGAQPGVVADAPGARAIVVGPNGTAAYPLDGAAPVTIDVNGQLGALSGAPGLLTDDGGTLVYTTSAQALARGATTPPPGSIQLADAGTFSEILSISPNQSWVIGTLDTYDYPAIDLYLASIATPGAVTPLSSTATASIYGDAFTADSSHALYLTAINSNGSGKLNALPVGGGTLAVLNAGAVADFALSGTKVVIDGNFDPNEGVADILLADVSTANAPSVLVSLADPYPFMNAGKNTIVYSWSYHPGTMSGIWALPVPK